MGDTALYCRTANGGADTMEKQFETLFRYVGEQGYAVSATYHDCNKSGLSLDRPGMGQLLSDIRAGKVKRVVVSSLLRLARSPVCIDELMCLFNKHGVELISVENGGVMDTDYSKELWDTLMLLVANKPVRRKRRQAAKG